MTQNHMKCAEVVEHVTDYLDDALATDDLTRLQRHVSVCPGCTNHVDEVRVMLEIVSAVPAEPLVPAIESRLMAVHREWAAGVRS